MGTLAMLPRFARVLIAAFAAPLVLANGMQAALLQSGSAKSHHNDVDCPQGTRPNFDPVVSFRTWILRHHGMSGLAGPHGELRNADAAYRRPAH